MARITKLYYPYVYKASGSQYYRAQAAWLSTYGDIVRTGPNELICTRPEILPVLAKAAKGTWYNIGNRNTSLQLERNKETHSIRRRVWDRAFTPAAIASYLPRIAHYRSGLLSALAGNTEKNITAWLSYYAFDVMGALTYGSDFGMLEKGGKDNSDYFLTMTHASMRSVGLLAHIPWVMLLLESLGAAGDTHMKFLAWCEELVEQRKKRGLGEAGMDLFEVLLEAEPNNKPPHYVPLQGDSRTAIVAGRYVFWGRLFCSLRRLITLVTPRLRR
jgi:cytochrome P450